MGILTNKTTSELRPVLLSPPGGLNSEVLLYMQNIY